MSDEYTMRVVSGLRSMGEEMHLMHEFALQVEAALNGYGVQPPSPDSVVGVIVALPREGGVPLGGAFNFKDGKWSFDPIVNAGRILAGPEESN